MGDLPLQTVRVIDHTIAWAGPQATLVLADMGAEVIKIEACTRPDGMRGGLRYWGLTDKPWEMGPWFLQVNRNKLDITLDLSEEAGCAVYRQLVKVSDVVVDNFTPRVMANLGLDYDCLKAIKPDIIQARLPGYGCTGPYKDATAYGDCINAFSGLDDITGYPDRIMRPGIAYGDPTSAFAAALGILAALRYRAATGRGQFVDVSHFEIASKAMDGILDFVLNGRVQQRTGNRDPFMAPQGCYPCRGEDQWATITIASDEEWRALAEATGNPAWAEDERFATVSGRRRHHDEVDRLIAAWTSARERYDVMNVLQGAKIAAAPVLAPCELLDDGHLAERGFFEAAPHPYAGAPRLPGMLFKLSETPGRTRSAAPLFGEHNQDIFGQLLGLSPEEIAALTAAGIIGDEPAYAKMLRRQSQASP